MFDVSRSEKLMNYSNKILINKDVIVTSTAKNSTQSVTTKPLPCKGLNKFNDYISARPNLVSHEDGSETFEFKQDKGFEHFRANAEGTRVSEYLINWR